jgi:hypothetical protein
MWLAANDVVIDGSIVWILLVILLILAIVYFARRI